MHARTFTGCCTRVSLRNARTRNGTRSRTDGPGPLWTEPTHNGRTAVTGPRQPAHGEGKTLGEVNGGICKFLEKFAAAAASSSVTSQRRPDGPSDNSLIHVTLTQRGEDIYIYRYIIGVSIAGKI